MQVLTTFILVDFAWIFFRANTVQDAFHVAGHLFTGLDGFFAKGGLTYWSTTLGVARIQMILALLSIAVMELVQRIDLHRGAPQWVALRPPWQRWALYTGLVASIIFLGNYYQTTQFIYFQF
jgi:hypothetical protein